MLGGRDASLLPAYPCWTLCFWSFIQFSPCISLWSTLFTVPFYLFQEIRLLQLLLLYQSFLNIEACYASNRSSESSLPIYPIHLYCQGKGMAATTGQDPCIASTVADYAYIYTWLVVAVEHPGSSMVYRRPNCVIVIVSTATLASIWMKTISILAKTSPVSKIGKETKTEARTSTKHNWVARMYLVF